MNVQALGYTYLAVLSLASLIGIVRNRSLDKGCRIIASLISLTCLNEWLAFAVAVIYQNNMPIYGVFNLIQLLVLGFYFNCTVDRFRKRNIGLKLSGIGVALGVINIVFFQPLHTFNSYFLLLESIAIISFSLYFFARLMLQPVSESILSNPHFWIASILTFFWAVTFFFWGFREYMHWAHADEYWIAVSLLFTTNILTYGGLGTVFLLYPRLKPTQ